MRSHAGFAALTLVFALSSCKSKEAPPAPPPPEPAAPAPLAVNSVDLGKRIGADKRVVESTTDFGTRDTIYASVETTGVSSGATLTARWTFEGGQLVDSMSTTIAPTGPAYTEFHITKKSAWPVGNYRVAILLNGAPAKDKEFEVKR
jgi:hypothetical protein